MAKADVNYSALNYEGNPFIHQSGGDDDLATDTDNEDAPPHSGLMIHVVPDTSKARWNHIEDLDSFFTRMYNYHQKHGFAVMMLQEVCELFQFIFVVVLTTFLLHGVNYAKMFREGENTKKVSLAECIYPLSQIFDSISAVSWMILSLAILFWIFRSIKVVYHAVQYWDVKKFYNSALRIGDWDLDNLTWNEVQRKIQEVQSEQQMCIHKEQLTELDIYHRILRFKNYMVAMMNKNLIPSKICLPFMGETVCFSRGLKYSIELILFRGPWSPFENNWHLREEYKRSNKRIELAQKLSRQITWIALAYLILSPLIFLWNLMVFFFSYADIIKREPGTLGVRCWSQYGLLYMRHFNELEHELKARLNRAYRPAVKYMNSFSSPLMAVIASNLVFVCGGLLSVFIVLTIYDEDVVQVEHVLTIMTVLTAIVLTCQSFVPEDNQIWIPETLMTAVLSHTHYLPGTWRGLAHTSRVREQFGQFFQFRLTYLINELLSPITIPYMLIFQLRPRALDIVDFFRNFTVSVVGVGDVCSFAQMDVRKHGNPDWQPTHSTTSSDDYRPPVACDANQYTQGENGKTELSLFHFKLTNPGWEMPNEAKLFLNDIRRHAVKDLNPDNMVAAVATNAMEDSLLSVGQMGDQYSSIVRSILPSHRLTYGSHMQSSVLRTPGGHNIPPNPFSPTTHLPHDQFYQHGIPTTTAGSQNRSTMLTSIQEDDDFRRNEQDVSDRHVVGYFDRTSQSILGTSMGASVRGRLSRREGPPEGSQEGLLHSLYNGKCIEAHPTDITATDMCLSTLYLHELHHRQLRRRGLPVVDQEIRQPWQPPEEHHHQQQTAPSTSQQHQTSLTIDVGGPSGGRPFTSLPSAVEKTPLLGPKKS